MDLDLKDVVPCPDCGYEGYEEDFAKGCPRCGAELGEPEEDEDEDQGPREAAGPPRPRAGRGAKKKGRKKAGGKKQAAAAPAPAKKLILSEEFKTEVFNALRRSDPGRAQELCFEITGENEDHARQVYTYLLGVAKKKGWVGAEKSSDSGPAPAPQADPGLPPGLVFADPPQGGMGPPPLGPPPMGPGGYGAPGVPAGPGGYAPAPGQPLAPLPLPPGLLGGGPAPGQPYDPLPMPAGILGDAGGQPGMQMPGMAPPGYGPPGMQPPGYGPPGMQMPGMAPPGYGPPGMQMPGMAPPGYGPPGMQPMGPPGMQPMGPGGMQPMGPGGMQPMGPGGMQPMGPGGVQAPPGGLSVPTLAPGGAPVDLSASQADLLPKAALALPEPGAPGASAQAPGSGAHAKAPSGPHLRPDGEPEEQGFLVRVAIEGRAAQSSLLCRAGRHAAARELAQSTLARGADFSRAHAALGEALGGLGEDQAALAAYADAVRIDPDDPVAIRGYAQLLTRLGRHQEAVNAYHRIVRPGQGELRDAVALAAALRRVGNVQGAQRVIEEVVKRDPQSLEPLRQAGEGKASAGDLDGAGGVLLQLLEKEQPPYTLALALAESLLPRCGQSVAARVACAQVFTAVNRPFDAVRLTAPVVKHQPGDLTARRVLGLALAALGAGPQAEEHLRAAIKQGGQVKDRVQIFRALGEVYLSRGDESLGIKALTHARDADPQDVDSRRALARALAAQGDLGGAIDELTKAHQLAGSDDNALEDELDRLAARAFTKRVKEAEARLLADESDAAARLELAAALGQRGDLLEAIRELEAAAEAGHTQGALDAAEELAEDHEDERPLVELRLRLLTKVEDYERAIEVLEGYLEQHSDDEPLRLELLRLYSRGQRVQDAVVGLRAFLEGASRRDLEGALALGEEILSRERGYEVLALPLGRTKRRLGDLAGGAELLQRYLASEPEDTEARIELAWIHESGGDHAAAYAVLEVLVRDGAGSTAELERLATLALAANRLDDAAALFVRAVEREPDDISLQRALETTQARLRRARIAELEREGVKDPSARLELAGLYAGEGRKDNALEQLRAAGRLGERPELDLLRFSAEAFAKSGQTRRAEAALRQVARLLNYSPGSDQHLDQLYRIASMYEEAGGQNRAAARRVFLELYARSPSYRDVTARLESLSEDVRSFTGADQVDERVLEVVHDGAPLATVFDSLQGIDLSVDARLLAGYKTDAELQAVRPD